jgi:hypothetical protein
MWLELLAIQIKESGPTTRPAKWLGPWLLPRAATPAPSLHWHQHWESDQSQYYYQCIKKWVLNNLQLMPNISILQCTTNFKNYISIWPLQAS